MAGGYVGAHQAVVAVRVDELRPHLAHSVVALLSFEQREGAFDIHRYDDEAAARTAIEDRVVYGAVVVTDRGPQLPTASAASPVVAQLLKEAVSAQAPAGAPVQVTDVVPTAAGDPRGSAAGAAVLTLSLWATLKLAAVLTGARRGGRPFLCPLRGGARWGAVSRAGLGGGARPPDRSVPVRRKRTRPSRARTPS
jgi:hypothetical protein